MRTRSALLVVASVLVLSGAATPPVPVSKDKAEMMGRVEEFLMHNFRDVTARKTIEWGEPVTNDDGTRSIRYRYLATIWGKDQMTMNQVFTFASDGKFVSVKNVDGFPKKD